MKTVALALLLLAGCYREDVECAPGFTAECASYPPGNNETEYVVECINLQVDPNHCGACGNSCGDRGCIAGACGACFEKGHACDFDTDCCSGKCQLCTSGSCPGLSNGTCD